MPSDPADPAPPLSDEELDRIRARLEAATNGPWRWRGGLMAEGSERTYAGYPQIIHGNVDGQPALIAETFDGHEDEAPPHAEFVANAPTDIAALLSALAAERAKRTALENFIRGTHYNRTVIDGPSVCVRCGEPWPCSTFAALSEGNE